MLGYVISKGLPGLHRWYQKRQERGRSDRSNAAQRLHVPESAQPAPASGPAVRQRAVPAASHVPLPPPHAGRSSNTASRDAGSARWTSAAASRQSQQQHEAKSALRHLPRQGQVGPSPTSASPAADQRLPTPIPARPGGSPLCSHCDISTDPLGHACDYSVTLREVASELGFEASTCNQDQLCPAPMRAKCNFVCICNHSWLDERVEIKLDWRKLKLLLPHAHNCTACQQLCSPYIVLPQVLMHRALSALMQPARARSAGPIINAVARDSISDDEPS